MATTPKSDVKVEVIPASARPVVKIGVKNPFQIVGGDVFTFIDAAKHRAEMTETDRGILVELSTRPGGPTAVSTKKTFLVPWGAVTYVQYGQY